MIVTEKQNFVTRKKRFEHLNLLFNGLATPMAWKARDRVNAIYDSFTHYAGRFVPRLNPVPRTQHKGRPYPGKHVAHARYIKSIPINRH